MIFFRSSDENPLGTLAITPVGRSEKQNYDHSQYNIYRGTLMRSFILLFVLSLFAMDASAVCSSQISRTNSSALSVLTASKYNTDLNTVYSRVNELPGDCIASGSVTTTQIADGTIANADISTSAAIALSKLAPANYTLSSSTTGSFSTSSTSYVDITNATATITTIGRPVLITVVNGDFTVSGSSVPAIGYVKAIRDSTDLDELNIVSSGPTSPQMTIPGGSLLWVDTPSAGTYTYKLQGKMSSASGTMAVADAKLFVREL